MISLLLRDISFRLRQIQFPEIDLVIGIGSGGTVPAAITAFYLNTELCIMTLNYRDEKNNPQREKPEVLSLPEDMDLTGKRILLVDDVSVSGKTLNAALEILKGHNVQTFTLKGNADYVLFPEIKDCVKWPWK